MAENDPSNALGSPYEIIVPPNALKINLIDFPDWVNDSSVLTKSPSQLRENQIQRLEQVGEPFHFSMAQYGTVTKYNGRLRVSVTISVPKTNVSSEENGDPINIPQQEMWTHTFPASYPISISIGTGGVRRVTINALDPDEMHAYVNAMMNGKNAYLTSPGGASSSGGKRRKIKKTRRRINKKKHSRKH